MTNATDTTSALAQVRNQPVIDTRPPKAYDICGARNRAGQPCQRPAGWGTESDVGRCKLHGGRSPNGRKHAATLSARQQLERLVAEPLTPEQYIDPIGALLHAVTEASMVVAYLREQVMELEDWRGDILSLAKDGFPVPTSEEARAIVKLYGEWHDRQVKAAKACAAAKIDERVVRLHEAQGARLDAAFRLFLVNAAQRYPEAFTAPIMADLRKMFANAFRELTPQIGPTS